MQSNDDDRQRKIREYMAKKYKYVSAKEYEGEGKVFIFNSQKTNPDAQGKFGPVIQYIVREVGSSVERIVNGSAVSLINSVEENLAKVPAGTDVQLRVKKTGIGSDTRYSANTVN